jgi:hypothetical protein
VADIFTKPLPNARFLGLVWNLLFRKPCFGLPNESGMEGTDTPDVKGRGKDILDPECTKLRGDLCAESKRTMGKDILDPEDTNILDQEGAELRGAKCAESNMEPEPTNTELLRAPDTEP